MARPFDDIFTSLALPFEGAEVRTRTQGGREMAYITGRTAANRLDDVLGPANWWDEYVPLEKCVVCKLTIRLADGSTVTKSDAGGYADMADDGDGEKAGFTDAFKRAAAKFGVGRHLYGDGVPAFVRFLLHREDDAELLPQPRGFGGGGGNRGNGGGYQPAQGQPRQQSPQGNANGAGGGQRTFAPSPAGEMPRDGRKLWGWCLDRRKEGRDSIVDDVNAVIEKKFGRVKMIDMSGEQVAAVWPLIVGSANGGGGRAHQNPADEDDSIPY